MIREALIASISIILFLPSVLQAEIIYQTNFDADPGWITNNSENFYWDPINKTYIAKTPVIETFSDPINDYAFKSINIDTESSYTISWDIKVIEINNSGMTFGGLTDDNLRMNPDGAYSGNFLSLGLGKAEVSNFNDTAVYFNAINEGNGFGTTSGTSLETRVDKWYTIKIGYTAEKYTYFAEIKEKETGQIFFADETQYNKSDDFILDVSNFTIGNGYLEGENNSTYYQTVEIDNVKVIAGLSPANAPTLAETQKSDSNLIVDGGEFYKNKPTIIITHGYQEGEYTGNDVPFTSSIKEQIKALEGIDANIVVYVWKDAHEPSSFIEALGYLTPVSKAVGFDLARKLEEYFGNNYEQDIQFIGHSYGTAVNASAANILADKGLFINQFTILDAPTQVGGVSIETFVQLSKNENIGNVENFYGAIGFGGGITALGQPIPGVFNTAYRGAGHKEVWKKYSEEISVFNLTQSPEEPSEISRFETLLIESLFQQSFYNIPNSTISIANGSDGYAVFETEIPSAAETLSFELEIFDIGEDDWFQVFFNDDLLLSLLGPTVPDGAHTYYLNIARYAGITGYLSFLLSSDGEVPAYLEVRDIAYLGKREFAVSAVPIPASLLLFGAALIGLFGAVRRKKTLGINC